MPNWNDVLEEIKIEGSQSALDRVRRKYLKKLNETTKRNVIAYYSGWLQKPGITEVIINDDDKNSLMAAIHKMDRSKGLDLILHTPGGDLTATESIVHYLKQMFGTNIRAIIPQLSMSAGTMIACSCKTIVMGKESNIGPIDPLFGGIPAHGVIEEFNKAIERVKADPKETPIWQMVIQKYHPTFIGECEKAIELSETMVKEWLLQNMFAEEDASSVVKTIVSTLSNHQDTKSHGRHIHADECKAMGLKIIDLETWCEEGSKPGKLQDIVLTIHHSYMHTFAQSTAIKIVENHNGIAKIAHFHPTLTKN